MSDMMKAVEWLTRDYTAHVSVEPVQSRILGARKENEMPSANCKLLPNPQPRIDKKRFVSIVVVVQSIISTYQLDDMLESGRQISS